MNREEITNNVGYAQEKANLEYIKYRQEHGVNDPYMITEIDEAFDAGYDKGYQYAKTHPNWISVKDKFPPENGKTQQSISVWATDGLTSGEFRYNFETQTWTDMWGDPFDITHWMQLPQTPRKEDKK
jgi:hypothetical protein